MIENSNNIRHLVRYGFRFLTGPFQDSLFILQVHVRVEAQAHTMYASMLDPHHGPRTYINSPCLSLLQPTLPQVVKLMMMSRNGTKDKEREDEKLLMVRRNLACHTLSHKLAVIKVRQLSSRRAS